MKKCLTLAVCLLAYAFSAVAQQTHWSYQEGQHQKETFIYADAVISTETSNGLEESALTDYEAYEYAAFVDDELRGIAQIIENKTTETVTYLLRFRIEGDDYDIQNYSSITFKAYDKAAAKELDMYPRGEQIVFTGETDQGIPSKPLIMEIRYPLENIPVTSITTPFYGYNDGKFSFIECNVGDDLTPYFVDGMAFDVLPGDATNKGVTLFLNCINRSGL